MGNRQFKKFRKQLRKEKQDLYNQIMDSIRELSFADRLSIAWKIIRKRC